MAGENCTLSVEGYGSRRVKVIQVGHGMSIAEAESSGHHSKHDTSFHAIKRTSGSFGITLIFAKRREFDDFNAWYMDYTRRLTDGVILNPMHVEVPVRRFAKVGVPKGTINLGAERFEFVWRVSLAFEGTRDPLEFDHPLVSKFQMARFGANQGVPYYLPAMTPSEGQTGEQMLYDEATRILRPGVF